MWCQPCFIQCAGLHSLASSGLFPKGRQRKGNMSLWSPQGEGARATKLGIKTLMHRQSTRHKAIYELFTLVLFLSAVGCSVACCSCEADYIRTLIPKITKRMGKQPTPLSPAARIESVCFQPGSTCWIGNSVTPCLVFLAWREAVRARTGFRNVMGQQHKAHSAS